MDLQASWGLKFRDRRGARKFNQLGHLRQITAGIKCLKSARVAYRSRVRSRFRTTEEDPRVALMPEDGRNRAYSLQPFNLRTDMRWKGPLP